MSRVYVNNSLNCKVISHNALDPLAVTRSETVVAQFDSAEYTLTGTIYSTLQTKPGRWQLDLETPTSPSADTRHVMSEIAKAALELAEEQEYRSDAVVILNVVTQPIPAISDAIN